MTKARFILSRSDMEKLGQQLSIQLGVMIRLCRIDCHCAEIMDLDSISIFE